MRAALRYTHTRSVGGTLLVGPREGHQSLDGVVASPFYVVISFLISTYTVGLLLPLPPDLPRPALGSTLWEELRIVVLCWGSDAQRRHLYMIVYEYMIM